MTTVGFLGDPPDTGLGALLSAFLMLVGFFLPAMVSAALAALFVREAEQQSNEREGEHAVAGDGDDLPVTPEPGVSGLV